MFGLAAGGSIAYGDGLYLILLYQFHDAARCLCVFVLGRVRINGLVVQQGALGVQADYFASGAVAGIDSHHPFLSQRGIQQKLSQVSGEDADSLLVGFLLAQGREFGFDGRFQKPFVCVAHRLAYLAAAFVVAADIHLFQPSGAFFVIGADAHFQQSSRLSPADGEQAVGGAVFQGFAEIEIIAVFGGFFLFAFHHFGGDDSLSGKLVAQLVAGAFVLVYLFGYDVSCAFQCLLFVFHISFHKSREAAVQMVLALQQQ